VTTPGKHMLPSLQPTTIDQQPTIDYSLREKDSPKRRRNKKGSYKNSSFK